MLRPHVEVVLRSDISADDLLQGISHFDGLIVRSRTQVTAQVIAAG